MSKNSLGGRYANCTAIAVGSAANERYALPFRFPDAFSFAQRRFTASAMRARPSGVKLRFFLTGFESSGPSALSFGLPLRAFRTPVAPSKARAC
jgi:hypothetical protein